jgi:multisubunit Na+/H+ antiporter MnhB subunit
MIIGSIYLLHAKDLLSAVISYGIVGFGLVICFMLLRAPDLAIIQIIIETITLIIMIAVILDSSRKELQSRKAFSSVITYSVALLFIAAFTLFFVRATADLNPFGEHVMRMSASYVSQGPSATGSANLVTGVLLDFRAYDTLGEATILFTAAIGVLTVLRLKGKKQKV